MLTFMKTSAPALLPILRSDAVGEILARLYLTPDRSWTLGDLAAAADVSLPTATREVTRMVAAGLLHEERVGKTRQVRINQKARLFEPLRQIIALTYGPAPVIRAELSNVEGVRKAFIYGSWAARHQGVEGPEPNDVDVLVVGDPDPDDLYDSAERSRKRLLREVNMHLVQLDTWTDIQTNDPFLKHVRASPLIDLDLEDES